MEDHIDPTITYQKKPFSSNEHEYALSPTLHGPYDEPYSLKKPMRFTSPPILAVFLGLFCPKVQPNKVEYESGLLDALSYLRWKNVTVAAKRPAAGIGGFGKKSWIGLFKGLEKKGITGRLVLLHDFGDIPRDEKNMVILLGMGDDGRDDDEGNIFEHKFRPDSTFLVVSDEKELFTRLDSFRTPKTFFAATPESLAMGLFSRMMTSRDGRTKLCSVELKNSSPPPCLTDAMGSELWASVMEYSPYVILGRCDGDEETDSSSSNNYNSSSSNVCDTEGLAVDVLTLLAELANFTWRTRPEPSGAWGAFPDGANASQATGMIGAVIRDEIDLPYSVWTITRKRSGITAWRITPA